MLSPEVPAPLDTVALPSCAREFLHVGLVDSKIQTRTVEDIIKVYSYSLLVSSIKAVKRLFKNISNV